MTRSNPGRRTGLDAGLALAAICSMLAAGHVSSAVAQPWTAVWAAATQFRAVDNAEPDADAENETADTVFLPAERSTLQKLAKARELLDQRRYGDAVRYLGEILDGPEDYFYQPDKKTPIHRSLKVEAQRLIGRMPREGRDLYELQYGARARQMLDEAVVAGDTARLAEVSRRFFHTRAGYQATFLLGMHDLDCGRPLAGALTLQRLREAVAGNDEFEPALSLAAATCWLQAGMPDKARSALTALREKNPSVQAEVGGRRVPIFAKDADGIAWLTELVGPQLDSGPTEADRWLVYRGDLARNAASVGSAPLLDLQWRVPETDDPSIETAFEQVSRYYRTMGTPMLPAWHPLAVDDVVVMRTAQTLLAVDFTTGKRLWMVPINENDEDNGMATVAGEALPRSPSSFGVALCQRALSDMTYGTLSSDGVCVFAIEGAAPAPSGHVFLGVPNPQRMQIGARRASVRNRRAALFGAAPDLTNRLAAYDLHTGKLKWHLGGPADQLALRQAETFFLGPPLPLMGQLYVLAEVKGEVKLLALDAATGDLTWSQSLAMVEQNALRDRHRLAAGISPSYAEGIMVCPTSTGVIVGVELATRSLLWGYSCGGERAPRRGGAMRAVPAATPSPAQERAAYRWIDAGVCICDDRILATPIDSDTIHCLSLIDGELLWKQPRGTDLYVGCVDQDTVVLVGRGAVRALRLSDGMPAWNGRTATLPDNSMPSGRGCLCDDRYYVPLGSGEVLGIDIKTGEITHVSKSRTEAVPGNLVCYKGRILSQAFDGLDQFLQRDLAIADVDRRLAADPDDPAALALRGEILLDTGQRGDAIACLRRAYRRKADPRTRALLRDALLEGLRADFAVQHRDVADLESLLDDDSQRAIYARLMAVGLQKAGDWAAAFDQYEKLIDLVSDYRTLDAIDKTWSVRRDRWIQARLSDLRRESQGAAAARITGDIDARLQRALASGSVEELQRFINFFGNDPAGAVARAELVRRLRAARQFLDAEIALWRSDASAEPFQTATATAGVCDFLRQAGFVEQAALGYRWLATQFPDVACCGGKPVRQWLETLAADDPLRRQISGDRDWPVGRVDPATGSEKNVSVSGYGRPALEVQGNPGPFLSDRTMRFDQTHRVIVGYDGFGRERWQVPVADEGQVQSFPLNRNVTSARSCGHLLFTTVGFKILAIDTLGVKGDGAARLLWSRDLGQGSVPTSMMQIAVQLGDPVQMQMQQAMFAQVHSRSSALGPATSRYVCFQQFQSIVAADPRTGETLWVHHHVPPGSELFGDGEYVVALPPNQPADQREAMVFRAINGELIGKRPIPTKATARAEAAGPPFGIGGRADGDTAERDVVPACGRLLRTWQIDGDHVVLSVFDPIRGETLWSRRFAANAHMDVVDDEIAGVFEPDGHFTLIGLRDGRTIADEKLPPEKSLNGINLFSSGDQLFLIVQRAVTGVANAPRPTNAIPGYAYKQVPQGQLYALDRQGKPLWPTPVTIAKQHLLLNQPDDVPVLTFACQQYDQQQKFRVAVLCVDKRTGQTIYKNHFPLQTDVFDIVGDPNAKTVSLNMKRNHVTLTFTNEPIPPGLKNGKSGGEKKSLGRALWNSVERAVDGVKEDWIGEEPLDPFAR